MITFVNLTIAQKLDGLIASIAPVASDPLIGFDEVPDFPVSVIDFQGLLDFIIPYDKNRYVLITNFHFKIEKYFYHQESVQYFYQSFLF